MRFATRSRLTFPQQHYFVVVYCFGHRRVKRGNSSVAVARVVWIRSRKMEVLRKRPACYLFSVKPIIVCYTLKLLVIEHQEL